MSDESIEISWSDCIVLFSSLISNIETLRITVESDGLDDDELYEAEEELNDYTTLLARLRSRYMECKDKGQLPNALNKKLQSIVQKNCNKVSQQSARNFAPLMVALEIGYKCDSKV